MSDQPEKRNSWDLLDAEVKKRLLDGDAAMAWLRKGESIERWREVGIAANDLMVAAMKLANTNNPVGAGYNRAWKDLAEHLKHIRDLDTATRTHAMWLANQWDVVEEWRRTLAASERLRLNHPSAVKRRYEQTHMPPSKAKDGAKTRTETYMCRWPSGTLSIVCAPSREQASLLLAVSPQHVIPLDNFAIDLEMDDEGGFTVRQFGERCADAIYGQYPAVEEALRNADNRSRKRPIQRGGYAAVNAAEIAMAVAKEKRRVARPD